MSLPFAYCYLAQCYPPIRHAASTVTTGFPQQHGFNATGCLLPDVIRAQRFGEKASPTTIGAGVMEQYFAQQPHPSLSQKQPRPRILVADDDPCVLRAVSERCKGMGFDVDTATSGLQVLVKAGARELDLIVVDVHMPEVDGLS